MKASTKSWHYLLYRSTYVKYPPNNLCPYFWSLIIAILLYIPITILRLPELIRMLIMERKIEIDEKTSAMGANMWVIITILSGFTILHINLIKAMFNTYSYDSSLANITVIIDLIIIAIVAGHLIYKNIYEKEPNKETNIVEEFIKAKYYKYCPKIEWVDEKMD